MRKMNLVERDNKNNGVYEANTCMIGINYLYSFSNKLENIRK